MTTTAVLLLLPAASCAVKVTLLSPTFNGTSLADQVTDVLLPLSFVTPLPPVSATHDTRCTPQLSVAWPAMLTAPTESTVPFEVTVTVGGLLSMFLDLCRWACSRLSTVCSASAVAWSALPPQAATAKEVAMSVLSMFRRGWIGMGIMAFLINDVNASHPPQRVKPQALGYVIDRRAS